MVLASAALGTFAGELGGYALGGAVGPRLRTMWLGRRLGQARWARVEAYLARSGARKAWIEMT